MKDDKTTEKPSDNKTDRRTFISGSGTLALALLAANTIGEEKKRRPREIPLHEADFYAPHSHAG
jgi:hypothetical protein